MPNKRKRLGAYIRFGLTDAALGDVDAVVSADGYASRAEYARAVITLDARTRRRALRADEPADA